MGDGNGPASVASDSHGPRLPTRIRAATTGRPDTLRRRGAGAARGHRRRAAPVRPHRAPKHLARRGVGRRSTWPVRSAKQSSCSGQTTQAGRWRVHSVAPKSMRLGVVGQARVGEVRLGMQPQAAGHCWHPGQPVPRGSAPARGARCRQDREAVVPGLRQDGPAVLRRCGQASNAAKSRAGHAVARDAGLRGGMQVARAGVVAARPDHSASTWSRGAAASAARSGSAAAKRSK